MTVDAELTKCQEDFPILKNEVYGRKLVYLDNAATTQKPLCVLDKISEFYKTEYSNIHRGVHHLSELSSQRYEDSRAKVSEFIGASNSSTVSFTSGTTDSINIVARSLEHVLKGNEVMITGMEHHSNIVPWQIAGATLKSIPMDGECNLLIDSIDITDQTKLIAITHVSNVTGAVSQVKEIIDLAKEHEIPVLVDAAQSVQHLPVNVEDLGCDFLVFSGHKMYATTGIGVLYISEQVEDLMIKSGGGGMVDKVSIERSTFLDPPLRYEAGTPNISGAISISTAIDYLQNIGMDNIIRHENEVYSYAIARLKEMDNLTVYGNTEHMCGSISFNVDNVHHYDAGLILDKMGIAVRTGNHCAQPLMQFFGVDGTIRASFALYNSKEDVDTLIEGINKVEMMHL